MALLSFGCRTTVEGLPNVQSFSTTVAELPRWIVPCRQSSNHFHFRSIKVIPLFRYSAIPFFRIPRLAGYLTLAEGSRDLYSLLFPTLTVTH